jgi:hypothetical protein
LAKICQTHSTVQLGNAREQASLVAHSHVALARRGGLLGDDTPHGLDDAGVRAVGEANNGSDTLAVTVLELQTAADRLDG